MQIAIRGMPFFTFTLEGATMTALVRLGAAHYDGTCRDACLEGGWLWGTENARQFMSEDHAQISGDDRKMQTILKILEMRPIAQMSKFLSTEESDSLAMLDRALAKALRHAYDQCATWTTSYDG